MKNKKKQFDVGKKVRRISREVFHGKLSCEKTMRDKKKFHKGSRGKDGRVNSSREYSLFCFMWNNTKQKSLFLVDCFK